MWIEYQSDRKFLKSAFEFTRIPATDLFQMLAELFHRDTTNWWLSENGMLYQKRWLHCVDLSKLYILPKSLNFTCCTVLFFFLYFITLSGNYRWINMFQMMVYRMFCAGFLRIFIFGICYQKSEMTHNPVFFSYVVLFIFHLQYWWWNCINHEIWLQLLSSKKLIVCSNKACCK